MMVIVAWVRMDALGGLLMIWLLAFVILPRSAVRVLWPFFLLYLAVLLPLQYAMALGLPPNYCISKLSCTTKQFKPILQSIRGLTG